MWLPATIAAGSQYRPPSRKLSKVGNPQGAGTVLASSFWMLKCKEWRKFIFPKNILKKINSDLDLCFFAERQEGLPRRTIFAYKFEIWDVLHCNRLRQKYQSPWIHITKSVHQFIVFHDHRFKDLNLRFASKTHVTNDQILAMDQTSIIANKTHSCLTSNIYDPSMQKSHVPSIWTIYLAFVCKPSLFSLEIRS